VAGYAVECGLKSCIVAKLVAEAQFPEKDSSRECWTHNLVRLGSLAGLLDSLQADADVRLNGLVVKDWSEIARYDLREAPDAQLRAVTLYRAITETSHGVLTWIQKHW
jgi:hypothetical protein